MKCRFCLNLQLLSYEFLCKFKHKAKIGSMSNFKLTQYYHEPLEISSLVLAKLPKLKTDLKPLDLPSPLIDLNT